jgi:hypothetical protein
MVKVVAATSLVLVVIYVVPFVVYGGLSGVLGLRLPAVASPASFLLGVLVTKLGTAVAFVLIFALSAATWGPRWGLYALLWLVMFACSEAGELLSGRTTRVEAILGLASEIVYTPLAAFTVKWMLWRGLA